MKIVIFGTGNAGRAIYRTFKNDYKIIYFIENNKNLQNSKYDSIPIKYVNEIVNLNFDKVAVAGVWADEMINQLIDLGISKDKIWFIEDTKLQFSSKLRVETSNIILKEFARLMEDNNISYCIEGSSLLCLLRGQNISDVSDIDILIKSQKDLEKIWEILNNNPILNQHNLFKIMYEKDKILTKQNEIDKIILKSKTQDIDTEPVNLDINLAVDIGKYYIMDYEKNYYLYFNKEFVDGKRYFNYKGINLLIPFQAEKFVELLYGKDWKIPAKKWTYLDYKNLLNTEDLVNFIKENTHE